MNQSIASEAKFRQRVVKYSYKNGVTKSAIRYHRSRQAGRALLRKVIDHTTIPMSIHLRKKR